MKQCRKCGVELNDDNWGPSYQKNWNNICVACNKKQSKTYHETHHTQELEYSRKYKLKHRNHIRKYDRKYRLKNRDAINTRRRLYMQEYYNNKRQEILEMHGNCCQICGSKEQLDIHHITPVGHGNGRLHTWNDLSKLEVLCRLCHTNIHSEMGVDVST